MIDASFHDGAEQPLNLKAETGEDLNILSALLQDSVLTVGDVKWLPKKQRLVCLLNRFRWEDREKAEAEQRPYERVRSLLDISNVIKTRAMGISPQDGEVVISLLSLEFQPNEDGSGILQLILSGDGIIEMHIECLEVLLKDVTKPYIARFRHAPDHGE